MRSWGPGHLQLPRNAMAAFLKWRGLFEQSEFRDRGLFLQSSEPSSLAGKKRDHVSHSR